MTSTNQPGGFLQPVLPSPSSFPDTSPSNSTTILPPARNSALRPGSAKESTFIEYVDRRLLSISRRYEKRFNIGVEDGGISDPNRGYENFTEIANDLELVHDVIWVSGTRTITSTFMENLR